MHIKDMLLGEPHTTKVTCINIDIAESWIDNNG